MFSKLQSSIIMYFDID